MLLRTGQWQDTVPGGCGCWRAWTSLRARQRDNAAAPCVCSSLELMPNRREEMDNLCNTFYKRYCVFVIQKWLPATCKHTQSTVASTKQPLTRSSSHTWNISSVGTGLTRGHQGYVYAHTLCTALQKCTSTVNCSGQLSSLKQMMFLKHTAEKWKLIIRFILLWEASVEFLPQSWLLKKLLILREWFIYLT